MDDKRLETLTQLLEEIVEDNTALVNSAGHILEAQDRLRADVTRELGQVRQDFANHLTFYVVKDVCQELLPPLTAIETMLEEADFADEVTIRNHVESLVITVHTVLQRLGLEKIPVVPGEEAFDPNYHECVRRVEPEESPFPDATPHTIVSVVENGYIVDGRIVRPAKVEVMANILQEAVD